MWGGRKGPPWVDETAFSWGLVFRNPLWTPISVAFSGMCHVNDKDNILNFCCHSVSY